MGTIVALAPVVTALAEQMGCSVAWAVTLYIDFANHNPVLTIVLHGLCAVLTATSAVLHFVRWRKMKVADTTPVDADSADTP